MSAKTKKGKSVELSLTTENGLTQAELEASVQIQKQVPEMVDAFDTYKGAEGQFKKSFWELADALRKPVTLKASNGNELPTHRLNGREVTLLLLGLGEIKQRVTEWKRVIEMDDASYDHCRQLSLPKLDTLKIARGSAVLTDEGEVVPVGETTNEDGKKAGGKKEASYHKFQKAFVDILMQTFSEHAQAPKASNDDVPYELSLRTVDGRDILIHVFVDDVPVKDAPKPEKK